MANFSFGGVESKIPARHRGTAALLLVIAGSLGIQASTAILSTLFADFSPLTVAGLRMGAAAVILFTFVRPNPFALKKNDWPQVLVYSVVVTLMTMGYFQAVNYLPLGIVVTIEYLGAFGVSLLGVRRWRDGLLSIGALLGVMLIAGPTFEATQIKGYLFAALSACSMAGYTILSARMGNGSPAVAGLKGLTLSICCTAIYFAPFSVPALSHFDAGDWVRVMVGGALGVAFAYSADALAGRLTSAAVIGVLFSLDPVNGALIGILLLGQVLPVWAYLGILLIAISGAVLVWKTNRSAIAVHANTAVLEAIVSTKTGQMPIIDPSHPKKP